MVIVVDLIFRLRSLTPSRTNHVLRCTASHQSRIEVSDWHRKASNCHATKRRPPRREQGHSSLCILVAAATPRWGLRRGVVDDKARRSGVCCWKKSSRKLSPFPPTEFTTSIPSAFPLWLAFQVALLLLVSSNLALVFGWRVRLSKTDARDLPCSWSKVRPI